ncbi:SHOCT domain-containing protein [Mesorhizobium erdmanii]|uniref:SHOCT domain-containing protein n=1 Tax=Mesorhizobium erdmanii TaxID=1777866 RepID=UPI0009DFB135
MVAAELGACRSLGFGPFLLILIGAGVVYYYFWHQPPREQFRDAASLEILDRRYASGEITKEQYEEMKGDLKKH